uniref:ZP domain-containing protein n=1 Tax=Heterorhabditis bacteriophora TaxID=37862 RepID=A0A1I7WJM2_HETBA
MLQIWPVRNPRPCAEKVIINCNMNNFI